MRFIQFSKLWPYCVVGNSTEWFVKDQSNNKILFNSLSYDECYKVAEKLAQQKNAREQTYEKLLADYNELVAKVKRRDYKSRCHQLVKQKLAAILEAMKLLEDSASFCPFF